MVRATHVLLAAPCAGCLDVWCMPRPCKGPGLRNQQLELLPTRERLARTLQLILLRYWQSWVCASWLKCMLMIQIPGVGRCKACRSAIEMRHCSETLLAWSGIAAGVQITGSCIAGQQL